MRHSRTEPFHLKCRKDELMPVSYSQLKSCISLLLDIICTLLKVLQCDWDWACCFAPCVVLKRTGMLRVVLPGLPLLRAALELYREIWSHWMQSEHGFWIVLCAFLLAGSVARAIAPGGQDLWIRWITVGTKGNVLRHDLQKSVMLLQTLSVVLWE